jgi:hypothetical protein
MIRKAGILLVRTLLFFGATSLQGQSAKQKNQTFYGSPMIGVLASQIDGDQASGYNKFGYQLGMATGFRLAEDKKLDAIEMQFCLVERGSRRAFDPLTMVNAFHIKSQQLEVQLAGIRNVKAGRLGTLDLIGGIRFTRLLKIVETEGYNPVIANDYAKNGMILQFALGTRVTAKLDLRLSWDYSAISLLSQQTRYNPFYPNGAVYHNGVGLTAMFRFDN